MNRFDKIKHEYYIDDRKLMNVTTFISRFIRPFNQSIVANKIAQNSDRTAEDILNEWDLKREIASSYGTAVHGAIEAWVKYGITPTQKHLQLVVEKFKEKFGHIEWKSEHKIFNNEYELGGIIDLISYSSKITADVKTNETFKIPKKERFLPPLSEYRVSNLNKVRLQTEVYNFLEGVDFRKFVYVWNGEDFEEHELEPLDISEIMAIRKEQIKLEKLSESI